MKATIEFDLDDEKDAYEFETHLMSIETRHACISVLQHIRGRLKYGNMERPAGEELEAVRAVLLEELDGWEP